MAASRMYAHILPGLQIRVRRFNSDLGLQLQQRFQVFVPLRKNHAAPQFNGSA
jgi:hypothetical protein